MLSIRHGGLVSRKDCSPVIWQDMRKAPERDWRKPEQHEGERNTASELPNAFSETPTAATSASETPDATSEMPTSTSQLSTSLDEGRRLDEVGLASDNEVVLAPGHGEVSAKDGAALLSAHGAPRKPNKDMLAGGSGSDGLLAARDEATDASLDAVELSADALEGGTGSHDASTPSSEASADSLRTNADLVRTSADPEATRSRRDSDAERPSSDLAASSLVNKQWQNDTLCLIDPFIRTKVSRHGILIVLFHPLVRLALETLQTGRRMRTGGHIELTSFSELHRRYYARRLRALPPAREGCVRAAALGHPRAGGHQRVRDCI